MPDVATTLNNLAILHNDLNDYEKALKEYEEALKIRRQLANDYPQVYLIDVAQTCFNLAFLYNNSMSEKEKAISFMIETTRILLPISEKVPFTQKYLLIALETLQEWGLSEEEIEQKVNDAMSLKDE